MWTLLYHPSATEQSFADWGIVADLPFEFNSQAKSAVDIITTDDFDDAFQWAYNARVTIFRDRSAVGVGGTPWFTGYVAQPRRLATGDRQNHRYTLFDWWWLAERTPFRRGRASYEGSPSAFSTVPPTEVVLFEDVNANKVNTGDQILEVFTLLNNCWNSTRLSSGSPFAVDVVIDGSIDSDLDVPRYPVRDTMCSEVLQQCLAWTQDAILETDYSVYPPVVSVRRLPSMPAEIVSLPADRAVQLELKPRYDLQLAGVIIYYKKTFTNDGVTGNRYYYDKWPLMISEYYPDARIHTVDLLGSSQSSIRGKLSSVAIDANHATDAIRVAWWVSKTPWLRSDKIDPSSISVSDVAVTDKDGNALSLGGILAATPNELIDGSIAEWMNEDQADVTFTAKVTFNRYADTDHLILAETVEGRPITCRLRATSAGPGTDIEYSTIAAFDYGEPIPVNLAQQIYESMSTLQHEGVITLVGSEIPANLTLGKLLTVQTPGATYADMLIQRISGELTRGQITLQVGPPSHLGITDMIELMMVNRNRTTGALPSGATNPVQDIGAAFILPNQPPRQDSTSGGGDVGFDAATATA